MYVNKKYKIKNEEPTNTQEYIDIKYHQNIYSVVVFDVVRTYRHFWFFFNPKICLNFNTHEFTEDIYVYF